MTNIFDDLPQHMPKELVQTLIQAADVRIERIISHGHASAADFWYDQPQISGMTSRRPSGSSS